MKDSSSIKIGIISDTHDQAEKIKKAISVFNKEKVSLIYYLGDICSPFSLPLFKDAECSVKCILGNNDADILNLLRRKPENMEFFGRFYADEFNGKSIGLFHGDIPEVANALFELRTYDLLLVGHTHRAEIKTNEKTTLINPGSLLSPFDEPSKGWTKPSVAIYDFEKGARIVKL